MSHRCQATFECPWTCSVAKAAINAKYGGFIAQLLPLYVRMQLHSLFRAVMQLLGVPTNTDCDVFMPYSLEIGYCRKEAPTYDTNYVRSERST